MSLHKAIENGSEHRKPFYKKCELYDITCRHRGSTRQGGRARRPCPWCEDNRTFSGKKADLFSKDDLIQYFLELSDK
jgi:hypothetical protein